MRLREALREEGGHPLGSVVLLMTVAPIRNPDSVVIVTAAVMAVGCRARG